MKAENKKVLVITYYWPPAGGSAIQRVIKFVKYMREYGWEPVILTVSNGEYPATDPSFLAEIPENIKVYKTKALQPFGLYKRFTGKKTETRITNDVFSQKTKTARIAKWIRMNLFIPDARVGWYFTAVKQAKKIIREEQIDAIFSSSPPHSLQLIAQKIATYHQLKWIADFRDPWSELVHNQNNKRSWLTRKIDRAFEKSVFSKADRILTVGKDVARCIRSHVDRPVVIIPNGYDTCDIPAASLSPEYFIITYTGELSKDRIPYAFLKAVSILKDKYPQIRLRFIGNSCQELKTEIQQNSLEEITYFESYIPHKESVRKLAESNALLLVINQVPNNKGILTGKIFEYLGMRKPIICIGPADGDAAQTIRECDAGYVADYTDVDQNVQKLEKLLLSGYTFRFEVEKYNRREQTKELCRLLDSVLTEAGK